MKTLLSLFLFLSCVCKAQKNNGQLIGNDVDGRPLKHKVYNNPQEHFIDYFGSPRFHDGKINLFSISNDFISVDSAYDKVNNFLYELSINTRIPNSSKKQTKENKIFASIDSLLGVNKEKRTGSFVASLLLKIHALPASSTKVQLFLYSRHLIITNARFYEDIEIATAKALEIINNIKNINENSWGRIWLGQFLEKYGYPELAIQQYYFVLFRMYKSKEFINVDADGLFRNIMRLLPDNTKNEAIYRVLLMKGLDPGYNHRPLSNSIYLDKFQYETDFVKKFGEWPLFTLETHFTNLSRYTTWYKKTFPSLNSDLKFKATKLIASNFLLLGLKDYALEYLFESIAYSNLQTKDEREQLTDVLMEIATIFAQNGQLETAIRYVELCQNIATRYNDRTGAVSFFLEQSKFYTMFSKQEIALNNINLILADTNLKELYPPYYYQYHNKAIDLKYHILESLTSTKDSLTILQREFYESVLDKRNDANNILLVHIGLLMQKINEYYNEQIKLTKKADMLAQENGEKAESIRRLNDTIIKKNKEDSATRKKNYDTELSNTKYKDSIKVVKAETEAAIKAKEKAVLVKNVSIIAGILLALAVYLYFQWKAKQKKVASEINVAKLNETISTLRLLNNTALSHDSLELFRQIKPQINRIQIDTKEHFPLKMFAVNYSHDCYNYFEKNYLDKDKLLNTVKEDFDLAVQYGKLWERIHKNPGYTLIDITHNALGNIEIPKHTLVNLISNSIKKGNEDKNHVKVDVLLTKKSNGDVILTIQDDGRGYSDLTNEKVNSGINLLLNQFKNYNEMASNPFTISFSRNNIVNLRETGGTGVLVTILLRKKNRDGNN